METWPWNSADSSLLGHVQPEAIGDVVALRIIAMARLGELDCDRLREGALGYLAEMKETATQARGD